MKIVLYARRNMGLVVLSYLVAKGHEVKVISDDEVAGLAQMLNCPVVNFDTMGEFDLFICCHGNKIIDKKYLNNKFINIHPCLYKYKGHNPIKRYIESKDQSGSVESQWMVEEVDAGEIIHQEFFTTPVLTTYAEFYNIALPYYLRCIDKTLNEISKRT
jgi:methionyl-tRNA formyltransferase